MRQSDKLEQFKENRTVKNALHSRYNYITGDPVIDDSDWGHLQIDGTSLFLLVLAQMIASGVQLIFSKDEVDFVQNLVYYIERAYRTPDYGMWEHPTYRKTSTQELHASSIGMAKSALDAIHGLNLFGEGGSPLYTVHVDPDAQYRNHVILDTLLPKESSSRETDSALLCITGFPAFGVKDESLLKETEDKVKNILEGSYGFRRFPKDPTYIGTESMTHIPVDFKVAEGNECQWPLMYIFKCITAMFRNDKETADDYWTKLKQVRRKNKEGYVVIPKFYRCSTTDGDDVFDSGKESKKMEPFIQDTPFLWCQAMYLIWSLLREGLVTVNDLDPLGVHLHNPLNHVASKPSLRFLSVYDDSVIQIALISESSKLQTILTTYGIPTQTVKQIEPITLNAPGELLLKVYSYLGKNEKLGLSGRPMRPVGAIGSSKVYQVFGHLNVFYPADLNMTDFYMSYDIKLFIDTVQSIIRFLNSYWNNRGRPTVTILLQQNLFQGGYFKDMISFLAQLKNGDVCGIRVRLDRLQALISMSCVDILECVSVEEEMAIKSSLTSRSGRLRSVSSSNSLSHSASSLSIAVDDVFNDDTLQSTSSVTTFSDEKPDYGPSTLANYDIEYLVHLFNNETNLVGKLYLLHEIINKTNSDFLIDHGSILHFN
jgi:phosphorylase kinase alpha/beta subunit